MYNDDLSENKTADLYGVTINTQNHLSRWVKHDTKAGPKPYLKVGEAAKIKSHLL